MSEWQNPEILRDMYHGQRMSTPEIGDELGCTAECVQKWMRKHGIETRSLSEAHTLARIDRPLALYTDERGYEFVLHRFRGKTEWVRLHRIIAVSEWGLETVSDMDVHHRNGVPWDNRPDNLEVMDHGDHSRLHPAEDPLKHIEEEGRE